MPENLPMYLTAPLLCAGIVVFSPMKQHGMLVAGKRIGVVGLGGIGHLAVKFGKAYGCHVTVISTSPSKENEAKRLGANSFLVSKNEAQMQVVNLLRNIQLFMPYSTFNNLIVKTLVLVLIDD